MLNCPECGAKMKKRTGKYGPFWGCSKYPDCLGTINVPEDSRSSVSRKRGKSRKYKSKKVQSRSKRTKSQKNNVKSLSQQLPIRKHRVARFRRRKSGPSLGQFIFYVGKILFGRRTSKRHSSWITAPNLLVVFGLILITLGIGMAIIQVRPYLHAWLSAPHDMVIRSQTSEAPISNYRSPVYEPVLEPCTFVQVIDGDTIDVVWNGEQTRVRFLRINTPEKSRPGYFEATRALLALCKDKHLYLEFEKPGVPERGNFGRLLAYVHADECIINIEMVRLGWSSYWTKYGTGKYEQLFRQAELEAQEAGRGLWKKNE